LCRHFDLFFLGVQILLTSSIGGGGCTLNGMAHTGTGSSSFKVACTLDPVCGNIRGGGGGGMFNNNQHVYLLSYVNLSEHGYLMK
jgi:hypothetical protein